MDRRAMRMLLLTLAGVVGMSVVGAACGGDDDDSDSKPAPTIKPGEVGCGKNVCALPENVEGTACCIDTFAGTCGIKAGGGASCRALPDNFDSRCPIPAGISMFGVAALPCCADDECGLDFGTLGGGAGCMPTSGACSMVPRQFARMLMAQKCDGEPIELPADCGVENGGTIPGQRAGASGGASAGAGGGS
jgi:hypothetical protein